MPMIDPSTPHPLAALPIPDEVRDDVEAFVVGAVNDVWDRPGLPYRDRSIATIAVLTALGRDDQLASHIGLGLRNGLTPAEVCEVIFHTAVYAGVPAALNGFKVAKEVLPS